MTQNKNLNRVMETETILKNGIKVSDTGADVKFRMKKIIILLLLLSSTIVKAQTQIDSIQFIGSTTDSLVFIVHSSINIDIIECYIESEGDLNNVKVNILYSGRDIDCYCPVQITIKIKKDIYQKAIVSIMLRNVIGGTEENPEYSAYWLADSKEIDLANTTSIDNFLILSKIVIFPNPIHNVFQINLGDNKVANLEIYDTIGSLRLSKDITSEKEIDISFLPSGLYFVLIDRKYISNIIKK